MSKVKSETIVLGIAPWDYRLLYYRGLSRHNKVVYHTSWHDWRERKVPRRYPKPLVRWLKKAWFNFLTGDNVKIVAVIEGAAQAVSDFACNKQVSVLPHCISKQFTPQLNPHEKEGVLKAIFVGDLLPKKGVLQAIDCIEELNGLATLTIVGDGIQKDAVTERLIQAKNCKYLGAISDRQSLADCMRSHDLLLVPSQRTSTWEELFGMVIVEAMASGLAVVASDHVGPRSILSFNHDLLISETDHQRLADTVRRMAQDPIYLEQIQRSCLSEAQRYKLPVLEKEWESVLIGRREHRA